MSEQLNVDERKEWAYTLYTKEEYSAEDTARIVNADGATVQRWIEEGEWDGVRRTLIISKNRQLKLMYKLAEQLQEKIGVDVNAINPRDVDLMVKYSKAIKNLETKITLSQMIDVFDQFLLWLRKKDSSLARIVSPRFDAFIKLHVR